MGAVSEVKEGFGLRFCEEKWVLGAFFGEKWSLGAVFGVFVGAS